MKKKLRAVLLLTISLIMIFASCPLTSVSAAEFNVKDGVLFSYNGKAQSLTIPSDVYYIADSAFENNASVTSVNLNNVSVIGNKAFANCTSLKTLTGADNVSSCGAYAFFNTPFIESYSTKSLVLGNVLVHSGETGDVVINSGVVSVAPYAFADQKGVTSVFVSDTVASIGEGAFYNCTSLRNVTIGKQVSYIGAFAFEGTPYLTSNKDDFVVLGNGILVDANTEASSVTVPDTVMQIGAGAFYNNKNIKSVSIPKGVTGIGMRAFAGCTALQSISLPEQLALLDKEAFSGCVALQSVVVPKSVSLIGESAFLGCTGLKTAQVKSSANLPKGVFAGCTSLESVMLSDGISEIGDYALYNCNKLKEISIPPTVSKIYENSFKNSESFSVWCKAGSMAELYCINKGISAYAIGDANLDGNVNIRDATEVQKATAMLVTMSFSACLRGDADFSGEINVRDATEIQKYIAGIY